jgi:hypothetical protein
VNETASSYTPEENYSATLLVDGGYVHINAKTLAALVKTVAQLRPTEGIGKTTPAESVKAEPAKPKAEPKKEAAAQVEKQPAAGAAGVGSTPTPASAPAAVASSQASASTDEAPRPTYDDVKKAVLAMAKISGDKALATLKSFTGQNGEPCDHGTKLKLEDYPAFLAKAQLVLDEVKA